MRFLMMHRGHDSAWGDLARDMAADPKVHSEMGFRVLREHIERESGGNGTVLAILDEMYAEWKNRRKANRN